jgi:hypothetical protein
MSTAVAASTSRVPVEFLGLARQFRNAVAVEDRAVEAALDAIAEPLRDRLRRKPALRRETPLGALRQFAETVPATFSVGRSRVAYARTEFAISEHRITSSWLHDDSWCNDARERGLSVCSLTFAVTKGKLIRRWTPIATVSLHALARRIERNVERDHTALVRDLAVLVESDEASERVDAPSGGHWLGGVIRATTNTEEKRVKLRNVRTWLGVG